MKLSHKQRAKRRWRVNRAQRAARMRDERRHFRAMVVRYKTVFGIIHLRSHPIFWQGKPDEPQPGFYDLTKK